MARHLMWTSCYKQLVTFFSSPPSSASLSFGVRGVPVCFWCWVNAVKHRVWYTRDTRCPAVIHSHASFTHTTQTSLRSNWWVHAHHACLLCVCVCDHNEHGIFICPMCVLKNRWARKSAADSASTIFTISRSQLRFFFCFFVSVSLAHHFVKRVKSERV